jgi:hypothetical protein
MLPKGIKLVKDPGQIKEIIYPMVPGFCAAMKKEIPNEVKMMLLSKDLDSFVLFNSKRPVGFLTISNTKMPNDEGHTHIWFAYVKKKQRAKLSHKIYETVKAVMDGLEIKRLSYTGTNERMSANFARRFKKYGINIELFGYHYQTIGE